MNNVRNESIEIRNRIFKGLSLIYLLHFKEFKKKAAKYIDELYLEDDNATEKQRLKHAEEPKNKITDLFVLYVILANTKAINLINMNLQKIYNLNQNDIINNIFKATKINMKSKKINIEDIINKYTKRSYDQKTSSNFNEKFVVDEIERMLKNGDGTKKISARIQRIFFFNKTSADTITLTETTRIQANARLNTMFESEKYEGLMMVKIWRHQLYVNYPRDWHLDMDGEERPLHERFSNNLLYPGEPGAPADEVINCHCFLDERIFKRGT